MREYATTETSKRLAAAIESLHATFEKQDSKTAYAALVGFFKGVLPHALDESNTQCLIASVARCEEWEKKKLEQS